MKITDLQKIYESLNTVLYIVKQEKSNKKIVLKVLKDEYPSDSQLVRFYNEYEYTHNINVNGVRKVIDKTKYKNKNALFLEYFDGYSIKEAFTGYLQINKFLKYAINISQTLGEIHANNIIHKDINSRNILANNNDEIKIIDFGISSSYDLTISNTQKIEHLEGRLHYISPEQTGRMNRTVDYRTDLYSLGIVFYELLTGRLPFEYDDSMKLIHAHIAENPDEINKRIKKVPRILSDVVMKLISKNAEDRYQSAFGVKYDLQKILFSKTPEYEDFILGEKDFSGKLNIAKKMYGRDEELKKLYKSYANTSNGATELLVISGQAGAGKSVFIYEIYKKVIENNGFYLHGKYEEFKRNIPYSALISAFNGFVESLLIKTDSELNYWRKLIQTSVGNVGKVLTNILPSLSLIIGKQPDIPALEGKNAKNRFNFVWISFIKAISVAEHPFVLYLDEMQWADSDSLELLKILFADFELNYFLCVTSHNEAQIDSSFAYLKFIEEQKDETIKINEIKLKNLTKQDIFQLINDTLKQNDEFDVDFIKFTDLIYSKTNGNIFFTIQLLENLYQEKLLYFDFKTNLWQWDIEQIKKQKISDNLIELLVKKVQKLPKNTRKILKIASCIGVSFSIKLLKSISLKEDDFDEILKNSLNEKIITTSNYEDYNFVDSKIQKSIYSTLEREEKSIIHYKIANFLINNIKKEKQEEFIFDIVNHYNNGISNIKLDEDKKKLSELNLLAATKAKQNAAFDTAYNYMKISYNFFDKQNWKNNYKLTLNIFNELAKLSYLTGKYNETTILSKQIIKKANNTIDKVEAYLTLIDLYRAKAQYDKAVEIGLTILESLGMKNLKRTSKAKLIKLFLLVKLHLKRKNPEAIVNQPLLTDVKLLAIIKIMDAIGSAAYLVKPDLFPILILRRIILTIKNGNDIGSPFSYASYGIFLNVLNKPDEALIYGKLALDLYDKLQSEVVYSKVNFVINFNVYPWKKRIHDFYKNFQIAYQKGNEIGDIEFTAYSLSSYGFFQNVSGFNLKKLLQKSISDLEIFKNLKQEVSIKRQYIFMQFYERMVNDAESTKYFNEKEEVPMFLKEKDLSTLSYCFIYKTISLYLFGNYEEAYKSSKESVRFKDGIKANYLISLHNFYYSLSILSVIDTKDKNEQKKLLEIVLKNQKILKNWSTYCEANFKHKYYLVEAERLKYLKLYEKARTMYEKAIIESQINDFLNEEAIVWERASIFFVQQKNYHIAQFYMQKAYSSYKSWGAFSKLKEIEKKYSDFVYLNSQIDTISTLTPNTISQHMNTGNSLDINTIIKASQTLSGEVKIENLLKKMLSILIENAGAQNGIIINNQNGVYKIEAIGSNNDNDIIIESQNFDTSKKLAISVVKYVIRTKKYIILDDAQNDKSYMFDDYIKNNNVKSIYCHPVIKNNKITAIIYLENNLSVNVFTTNRIEIVNMLSAQIAISIENALLYENLEQKVEERTKKLKKANNSITDSIVYARRIQKAIIPSREFINKITLDNFIFFKPRDIVSGDFYWAEQKGDFGIIVAADCTGHGVPGAFLSMLGISLLDRIVADTKEVNAAYILDKLRIGVKKALHQELTLGGSKDGMDIAIICFDKKTKKLQYAGAYNPLYIIRDINDDLSNNLRVFSDTKISTTKKLIEIKANRMPIGIHYKVEKDFTNNVIDIKKDDLFYIFTDGYADQFGGKKVTKFLIKKLKKLLLQISEESLSKQKDILENTLKKWQGPVRQLDDILVIGLKIY